MSKIITVPFTEKFLPHVVAYIRANYIAQGKDLSRLAIVFGGRRPSLFVKRELAQLIGKPFVPPQFFTIDEWMAQVGYGDQPPRLASDLDHSYMIHQLACQLAPSVVRGRESFAQFLPWAKEILHFIEQLDLEDVAPSALTGIKEHARIGFSVPEDINKLLMHLGVLRKAYHGMLQQENLATRGFQYLQAARRVNQADISAFDEILFCNFFYLHRTENAVIKNLYDRTHVTLFMQGDQRRWPALERIAKTFGTPVSEGADVVETQFDLKIYEAFDAHAQAGLVKEILEGINDPLSTVIVLPDADFLLPLLTAMGGQVSEFNISMGYPLKRSALYALLTLVLQAQLKRQGDLYYARDYLKLLQHPLVKSLGLKAEEGVVRVVVHKIEEALKGDIPTGISGSLFFALQDMMGDDQLFQAIIESLRGMGIAAGRRDIEDILLSIHKALLVNFENVRCAKDLSLALEDFLQFMQAYSSMGHYPFNAQIALRLSEVCDELATCAFAKETFEARDMFRILEERLSSQMVAFTGSPLRGLQVLGLFETRSLNFDHVIIVDVNEGLLPNLNMYEPLIPREVMIKLNLDRLELEEEIQRYGFMRLISAARDVHLVYQKNSDRARSRFVEELIWEQEERHAKIGVVDIIRPAFEVAVVKHQRIIPKTPQIVDFLKNHRFSASSVNTYLRNPYEFYCQYVLGLRDKEDLLEDPEGRHIGTFIHGLLEEAFKGFVGKKPVLDDHFQKYFYKIYESRFNATFGKAGRNDTFLMATVLKTRLERFLQEEALRCARSVEQMLHVESKFEDVLSLGQHQVRFSYRLDRVDLMSDGTILLLDYKTGGVDQMPKNIALIEHMPLTRENIRDYVQSFQMPLYVQCLHKQFPQKGINAALYQLRTMSLDHFLAGNQVHEAGQLLPVYMKALSALMAEILDPNIPFVDDPT